MAANHIPQAQRSQEKKYQIYSTAMKMFREKGYSQTTIRDICAAAGITTGTFYNFFGDKFGILQEHFRRLISKREVFLEFSAEKLANPYQAICDYFFALSVIFDRLGRELSREFTIRSPEMITGTADPNGNGIHHIALFLGKAQASGAIPAGTNPWYTAEFLVSGYMGIMQYWQNFSNDESMEEIVRRMLPMLFASVSDSHIEIQ